MFLKLVLMANWGNKVKVAIIGDYASQSYFIGRELEKKGYEVEYFLQYDEYTSRPDKYHYLGAVRGPKIVNYMYKGFWMTVGRIIKTSDIQIVNGTYWKCVRSKKTCYHYHGSDLRMKRVKARIPSFVSLRELQKDYSKKSVFLPRAADDEIFKPIKEIKEKKEEYKSKEGIDYIIGHYAHSPHVKGSHLFKSAIESINKEEGIRILFRNQPVPRERIVEELNFCDFILDHVNPAMGKTYNVISIESLLCETPVGSYYDENYIDFPEMKENISLIDPKKVKDSILAMLSQKHDIRRKTIIKFHSPESVVERLLSTWKKWGFI